MEYILTILPREWLNVRQTQTGPLYRVIIDETWDNDVEYSDLWPLLLTWFNFNPSMDK